MSKIKEKTTDVKTQDNDISAIEMDGSKPSKIFLATFFLAIALSLGVSYWHVVVRRDYDIIASADCDPYEEKCFVHVCNPDPNVDGADCTGDPDEDIWYTKNMNRRAYNVPDCDPNDENCSALKCGDGEAGCFYELCDEGNVPEGDKCNDPEQYARDNPIEEDESDEAVQCEDGDDECAAASDGAIQCEDGDEECAKDGAVIDAACDSNSGDICHTGGDEE